MTDFERGDVVKVSKTFDLHYECEARVIGFNSYSGEYHVEMLTGDAKHDKLVYSAADLTLTEDD